MALVHDSRIPPALVFGSTALDLFGPIKIRDSVKRGLVRIVGGSCFATLAHLLFT